MADNTSEPKNVGRSERRGSLGKVFEKLKTAMRRKSSSSTNILTSITTSTTPGAIDSLEHPTESCSINLTDSTQPCAVIEAPGSGPSISKDTTLPSHYGNSNEHDEPLLPMMSSRTGISEEKARLLFEKYGVPYEPRRRLNEHEPPSKLRRVERPVRIRVHWECHECHNHFARDRTCASCGHGRCPDCIRAPAKRVKEIMELGKKSKEREEQQEAVSSTESKRKDSTVLADPEDRSAEATASDTLPAQAFEMYCRPETAETDLGPFTMSLHTRPRSGEDLIARPKSQIIRRSCHECDTPFIPAGRTECQNCQHSRCTLCPRYPAKTEKWGMGWPDDWKAPKEEVRTVRVVQRVYRKPRQRVRYTCELCSSNLNSLAQCNQCGHAKCRDCARNPPRRTPMQHDPILEQAVTDRLVAYSMPERMPTITAAG